MSIPGKKSDIFSSAMIRAGQEVSGTDMSRHLLLSRSQKQTEHDCARKFLCEKFL